MSESDSRVAAEYIDAARHALGHSLSKIAHCFDQLDDAAMGWRPFPQQNSLTNLNFQWAPKTPEQGAAGQ